MSSIASLQREISEIEQRKSNLENAIRQSERHGAMEVSVGDMQRARDEIRTIEHYKREIEQYETQIRTHRQTISSIERQILNVDDEISTRRRRHESDLAQLDQKFRSDIEQYERQKIQLRG